MTKKIWNMLDNQRKISFFPDTNVGLERRISNLEDKLDAIITLLNKEEKNDKDRPKSLSGNDSGVWQLI